MSQSKVFLIVYIVVYMSIIEFGLWVVSHNWSLDPWLSANLYIICSLGWIPIFNRLYEVHIP